MFLSCSKIDLKIVDRLQFFSNTPTLCEHDVIITRTKVTLRRINSTRCKQQYCDANSNFPSDEVNILNTFRVMIILILLLLLTNLHLKLLSTQGTGADKLLSTHRVKDFIPLLVFLLPNMNK